MLPAEMMQPKTPVEKNPSFRARCNMKIRLRPPVRCLVRAMKTMQRSFVYGIHSISKKNQAREEKGRCEIATELKKVDDLYSPDIATLRAEIESASLEFNEAQKRFDKCEKEYVDAKTDLFLTKERKDHLVASLGAVLKQSELDKAKTISGLVGRLELAPYPGDRMEEKKVLSDDDLSPSEFTTIPLHKPEPSAAGRIKEL